MLYTHGMAHQSETELLAQRLDAIRTEKAALMKKVEELNADEQRINYALDVFRSVVADLGKAAGANIEVALSGVGVVGMTATGMLSVGAPVQSGAQEQAQRSKQTLESLILDAFAAKDGMTSVEVAGIVELVSDAKKDSIMSTLSRMAGKGLVRREGKLYFRGAKGEGSGVVGTTEPSGATTSGDGLNFQQEEEL